MNIHPLKTTKAKFKRFDSQCFCSARPKVVDSRMRKDSRSRRYECPKCKHRWTTYEYSIPKEHMMSRKNQMFLDRLKQLIAVEERS